MGSMCGGDAAFLSYSAATLQRKYVKFSRVTVRLLQDSYTVLAIIWFLVNILGTKNRTQSNSTQEQVNNYSPTQPMG